MFWKANLTFICSTAHDATARAGPLVIASVARAIITAKAVGRRRIARMGWGRATAERSLAFSIFLSGASLVFLGATGE